MFHKLTAAGCCLIALPAIAQEQGRYVYGHLYLSPIFGTDR